MKEGEYSVCTTNGTVSREKLIQNQNQQFRYRPDPKQEGAIKIFVFNNEIKQRKDECSAASLIAMVKIGTYIVKGRVALCPLKKLL